MFTLYEEVDSSVIDFEYLKIVRVIKNLMSIVIARHFSYCQLWSKGYSSNKDAIYSEVVDLFGSISQNNIIGGVNIIGESIVTATGLKISD